MLVSKARAYSSGVPERSYPLGYLLGPNPQILDPGSKGLPGTNTPAYYTLSYITTVKSFIPLGPGLNAGKLECTHIA